MPLFNTEGRIRIREGRHPLLDKKSVVPITVMLGEDFDLLIVTVSDSGGKTVSLKTVGLFTLMGQAGLHIPALGRLRAVHFHSGVCGYRRRAEYRAEPQYLLISYDKYCLLLKACG